MRNKNLPNLKSDQMNEITLDFTSIPSRPVPVQPVIDITQVPVYENTETAKDDQKSEETKKRKDNQQDIIPVPPFAPASEPQPRIIIDKEEDISEIVHIHQRLEVLEHRIRFHKEELSYETDQVAQLYMTMPDFKIERNELFFLETYNIKQSKSEIPNFWEPRVFDREEEKLNEEDSKALADDIDETKKIVMVEKPERTDWREMKRLMRIVETAEDSVMMKERKNRGLTLYSDQMSGSQYTKRRLEPSGFVLSWEKSNLMTDNSSDETEIDDFVL